MARLMCRRALWFQRDGGSHNFIVAAARMVTTRSNLLVADTLSEAVGDRFFEDRYSPEPAVNGAIEFFWRYMQAGTVAAGTTEMLQRDLSRGDVPRRAHPGDRSGRGPAFDHRQAHRRPRRRGGGASLGAGPERAPCAARRGRRDRARSRSPARALRGAGRGRGVPRRGSRGGALADRGDAAPTGNGRPLAKLSAHGRLEHGDLFESWDVATVDGHVVQITSNTELIGSKVGPFVNREPPETIGAADPLSPIEHALLHVLPSWYLLGAAEHALDLATVYATERVQFGQPIASYQGVAFPLADACSELQALYELALDSLHRVYASPEVGARRRARFALGGARCRAPGVADIAPSARRGRVLRRARPHHHHARTPGAAAVARRPRGVDGRARGWPWRRRASTASSPRPAAESLGVAVVEQRDRVRTRRRRSRVDRQQHPRDPAALLGGEEHRGPGHVPRQPLGGQKPTSTTSVASARRRRGCPWASRCARSRCCSRGCSAGRG